MRGFGLFEEERRRFRTSGIFLSWFDVSSSSSSRRDLSEIARAGGLIK
jgi:hypothetical protein